MKLPPGRRVEDLYTYAGDWGWGWDTEAVKPKCECGSSVTLGKEDHPQFHSDYCPIYIEWKKYDKKE